MPKRTLLLGMLALAAAAAAPKKPAPAELNLTDLDGGKVHLRDYRGKIVVLNFWATWCGPCREEMPLLVSVEKEWLHRGVEFIGVSLDERPTQKNIAAFVRDFAIGFPIWKGAAASDLSKLGMGDTIPGTAFLDEDGIILMRVQGKIKKTELVERLEWISGDRKGPPPNPLLRNV